MLRLLETFLKSAPQLVLQLSIMVQAMQVLPLQGELHLIGLKLYTLGITLQAYLSIVLSHRGLKLIGLMVDGFHVMGT